jgi:hypothetical protein
VARDRARGPGDRGGASLDGRATILVSQRETALEQYGLACGDDATDEAAARVEKLQVLYRSLECELLGKDAEIAAIDAAYDEAVLESTRILADGNVKTKFELVVEEYALSQSAARMKEYVRRARRCSRAAPR